MPWKGGPHSKTQDIVDGQIHDASPRERDPKWKILSHQPLSRHLKKLEKPQYTLPEMIGNVKLSSGNPKSSRNINISANVSVNQRRNLPSASATSFLTRLATTEITNKPNKLPAPILVG
jgi:hypothetical protein